MPVDNLSQQTAQTICPFIPTPSWQKSDPAARLRGMPWRSPKDCGIATSLSESDTSSHPTRMRRRRRPSEPRERDFPMPELELHCLSTRRATTQSDWSGFLLWTRWQARAQGTARTEEVSQPTEEPEARTLRLQRCPLSMPPVCWEA